MFGQFAEEPPFAGAVEAPGAVEAVGVGLAALTAATVPTARSAAVARAVATVRNQPLEARVGPATGMGVGSRPMSISFVVVGR
jgi:hypothetical protein